MSDKEEGFHKSIVKATGIFGFVQIIKLFVKVIVGKFTAIFLGPEGVGLVGLLTNSLDLIGSFTGLGFNITGSRAIAIADSDSDDVKVSETIVVLNKWALIIGVSGAILSSVFSKWLSVLTFGTSEYYYWFIFLSLYFVFSSFTAAYGAILQGKRLLKYIALSSIISTFIIALTTFLLYYFFRKEGIVIVIIVTSLITAIVNFYFVNKIKTANVIISFKEIIKKGLPIIKTGFLLSINVIFGRICFYIIRLFLNQGGASAEILGFYEVSLVIFVSYLGIVFTAMSTDYFPQLSSFKDDKLKFIKLVNHQIEISVLIITPSILFIYLTGPYLLEFLYTKDFKEVYLILKLGLLAMLFKAIIWPLGFMILAKGDNRQYFKQEIISDFMNISFTIFFYKYLGLIGIGIAMLMNYLLYGMYIYYYLNKKYDFVFFKEAKIIIWVSFIMLFTVSLLVLYFNFINVITYLILIFLISVIYSLSILNRKIDLKKIYRKIKNKFYK